jgi:hypothetical protein
VGGNGGSLSGIRSGPNSQAHYNLIGGDGGDTITYGTPGDPKTFVGRGGSISVVRIDGDIGNITGDNPNTAANDAVAIKSYNDMINGETFQEWVDAKMRLPDDPFFPVSLTDLDGNVGIVVGAAGRNKAAALDPNQPTEFRSQPATGGKSGDLVDVIAKNLLSAVAGSVQRIAAINIVKGLQVSPGVIGAEKGFFNDTPHLPNYYMPDGVTETPGPRFEPVLEGRLVSDAGVSGDGAVVAHVFLNLDGSLATPSGKSFIR